MGASVLSGLSLVALNPTNGVALLLLDVAQLAGAVALVLAIRGRTRRWPDGLAFVYMLWVTIVPLATLALQPDRLLLVGASLALMPSAVALFVPWSPRVFGTWAVVFAGLVSAFIAIEATGGRMALKTAGELALVVALGMMFGILGNRIHDRHDRDVTVRDETRRRLASEARRQGRALVSLNSELSRVARTDALTGMGNRLRMDEELAVLADRLRRYGQGLSMVLFDLDRFKLYNDRYGHLAGDDVLVEVARVLAAEIRPSDSIHRFGGEELLVLLPGDDVDSALATAERLRRRVVGAAIPHEGNQPWAVVTISGGVVCVDGDTPGDWPGWFRAADRALYAAKAGGRNRSELCRAAEPRSGAAQRALVR